MAIWTVLTRELSGETEVRRAERVVLVREKASVAALFFAPLVLLRFRLWLALAGYAVALIALGAADRFIGLPTSVEAACLIGLHLLVALELPSLRIWKLRRTGHLEAGAVVAEDRDDAERRFFADYESSAPSCEIQRPRVPGRPVGGVIGSFPEVRPS